MHAATLLSFCAAWAALVVLPGPDTALVAGLGITRGRRAAAGAAVGSLSALAIHVTAVGVGLSALLASSATLFTALKLVGAAYLVAMGLRLVLARAPQAGADAGGDAEDAAEPARAPLGLGTAYRRGLLCGVTNPKSAVFFLTFLPQFLDADRPALPQLALLGVATVVIAGLWHATILVAVGRLRSLAARPRVQEVVERLTGTAFVVLGSRLATAAR